MPLERTLEPEVMDSAEDAREYDDMDHSVVNKVYVDELLAFAELHLEKDEDDEIGLGDVLDLGTGTAQIPVELCKRHWNCRVMAIDMAVSMLDLAIYNIEAAGLADRITLGQSDAKQMGFEDELFDAVISNSILHHLAEPQRCIEEISRVCKDGGLIFIRDLMRPSNLEQLESIVSTYAGEESEYSQRLFRDSLHAALTLDEMRQLVADAGYNPQSVSESSDRHWTWAVQKSPS